VESIATREHQPSTGGEGRWMGKKRRERACGFFPRVKAEEYRVSTSTTRLLPAEPQSILTMHLVSFVWFSLSIYITFCIYY
jgi:hypothetical protein